MTQEKRPKNETLDLIAEADETWANMSDDAVLEIEKAAKVMPPELGENLLQHAGVGMDIYQARPFVAANDDPRHRNARLSRRSSHDVVVEREEEIRHTVFVGRDSSSSMQTKSGKARFTKKEYAEIKLLALIMHLDNQENAVSVVDSEGVERTGSGGQGASDRLFDVKIITGDIMDLDLDMPEDSHFIYGSDFLMPREKRTAFEKKMNELRDMGVNVILIQTLDPNEIDFEFPSDTVELRGAEGEADVSGNLTTYFDGVASMRAAYQEALKEHVAWLNNVCQERGFDLLTCRTTDNIGKNLMTILEGNHTNPIEKLNQFILKR